jgi:hypothetical protein
VQPEGTTRARAGDAMAILAVAIAVALAIWLVIVEDGWLGMVFGRLGTVFWLAVAVWIGCVTGAILWRRRWWVLLTAPALLYPIFMSGMLLVACLKGNCL